MNKVTQFVSYEKMSKYVADITYNVIGYGRNISGTDVLSLEGLNVFDLLVHEKIVCTSDTLKKIEERLN